MTILVDESTVATMTSAARAERPLQSSTGEARENDDEFDFPLTVYPGREVFTFGLFVLAIMTFAVWGGWRFSSLILSSLM